MAELNSSASGLRGGSRTSTVSPRVDMTPMVDLMFLLITFFMLTTTLSKPVMLQLAMPVDAPPSEIADIRTFNLCIGDNNRLIWYKGSAEKPLSSINETNFGKAGLRELLKKENLKTQQLTGSKEKGIIVQIKPGENSNYKNLVDVLDELKITGISTYLIVDNTAEDLKRMKTLKTL